jgi:hypothetical protein
MACIFKISRVIYGTEKKRFTNFLNILFLIQILQSTKSDISFLQLIQLIYAWNKLSSFMTTPMARLNETHIVVYLLMEKLVIIRCLCRYYINHIMNNILASSIPHLLCDNEIIIIHDDKSSWIFKIVFSVALK